MSSGPNSQPSADRTQPSTPTRSTLLALLLETSAALARFAEAEAARPADTSSETLLTMPEVARMLQVKESCVRELGRRGRIRTVRIGVEGKHVRVRPSDLQAYLESLGDEPAEGGGLRRGRSARGQGALVCAAGILGRANPSPVLKNSLDLSVYRR